MPKLKRRLGINLTASNFQYVEISFTGQEFQLESCGDCDLDEEVDWCNGKETIIRMQLDNLFSELKKRKIKTNFVSFSLPFDIFLINQLVYHQELIDVAVRRVIVGSAEIVPGSVGIDKERARIVRFVAERRGCTPADEIGRAHV